MFCSQCGSQLAVGSTFCGSCGSPVRATGAPQVAPAASGQPAPVYVVPTAPQRDFLATWLFSLFFGALGVDRFYLGYVGSGIGKLVLTLFTGIGGYIWHWVDLILLLSGRLPDAEGRPLLGYAERRNMAIWVTVGLGALGLILFILVLVALIGIFTAIFGYHSYSDY